MIYYNKINGLIENNDNFIPISEDEYNMIYMTHKEVLDNGYKYIQYNDDAEPGKQLNLMDYMVKVAYDEYGQIISYDYTGEDMYLEITKEQQAEILNDIASDYVVYVDDNRRLAKVLLHEGETFDYETKKVVKVFDVNMSNLKNDLIQKINMIDDIMKSIGLQLNIDGVGIVYYPINDAQSYTTLFLAAIAKNKQLKTYRLDKTTDFVGINPSAYVFLNNEQLTEDVMDTLVDKLVRYEYVLSEAKNIMLNKVNSLDESNALEEVKDNLVLEMLKLIEEGL